MLDSPHAQIAVALLILAALMLVRCWKRRDPRWLGWVMLAVGAIVLLMLSGCGHLTFDLRGHEISHCTEWGIPGERIRWHYVDDAGPICRPLTGLVFVDACASVEIVFHEGVRDGETICHIWIPKEFR